MEKFIISGGYPLQGNYRLAGAKNVALKTCVCSLLTDETVIINNIPLISDLFLMKDLLGGIGVVSDIFDHSINLTFNNLKSIKIPLEIGARLRTSSLIVGPMLARFGEAIIPNPGGCRIGARPIDRHIEGLQKMGAEISYVSNDGYFHAKAKKLHGAHITFSKNTHTGTEALLLAAVLAEGQTVISNAAEEVEVNDLINLLIKMGAKIKRTQPREITIEGVNKLHGTEYEIMSDRNEEVTIAIAAVITKGNITVEKSTRNDLKSFLNIYQKAGGIYHEIDDQTTRYTFAGPINPTNIETKPHPGFMTDWQAPWALFMTQANGISTIHETVFESRFSYVNELIKMGAKIEFFQPQISDPMNYYNFNWTDFQTKSCQAIKIYGPANLHNAILEMHDLRAGASLLLAALTAEGDSYVHGIDQIDRGYENIENRLKNIGAKISRNTEEAI
jgi:UDP-N-acetylglucosamine 1-carboxyvinyltransferase